MTVEEAVTAAEEAASWDARVAVIRQVPEQFGTAALADVYAAIARRIYVPSLAPDFAYVHWRADYQLEGLQDVRKTAQWVCGWNLIRTYEPLVAAAKSVNPHSTWFNSSRTDVTAMKVR